MTTAAPADNTETTAEQDARRQECILEVGQRLNSLAANLQAYGAQRGVDPVDIANCYVAVGVSGLMTILGNAEAANWLRFLADEVEREWRPGH